MTTREEIFGRLGAALDAKRGGHLADARRLMYEAERMCSPEQTTELGCVQRELGELARTRSDLHNARKHYEQAVALLRPSAERLKFAHTVRHLGDVLAELRDASADQCYQEALAIYRAESAPPPLDFANAVRAYAAFLSETAGAAQARDLWAEALPLYRTAGIAQAVAECERRMLQTE